MIPARTYFRATLALPLVVPLLSMALWLVPGMVSTRIPALLLSSLMLGPPYLLLAGWLWRRLGLLDTAAAVRALAWRAPLWFLPLALLWAGLWMALPQVALGGGVPSLRALAGFAAVMALYVLGLGYAYVLLALLGYGLGRHWRWIGNGLVGLD